MQRIFVGRILRSVGHFKNPCGKENPCEKSKSTCIINDESTDKAIN